MKKNLFLLIAILFSIASYAQTPVPPGPISGTWTLTGSPYLIQGETTIEDGTTLTIEPKVKVEFQGSYPMWVEGQILAVGTESDSIIFTAADPLTGWKGVRFDSTLVTNDTSRFEYCVFEYGKANGLWPDNCGGAIVASVFSKFIVDHCLFDQNEAIDNSISPNPSGGAIALDGCSPRILNSRFTNNKSASGAAIVCAGGSLPEINNNLFTDNTAISYGYWGTGYGGAITIYLNSDPDIINNTFHDNHAPTGGGAIAMVDKCNPLIDHNLIYNNTCGWIGGGIEIQDTCSPIIINNTIADNTADEGGGIDIWGPNTPEIRNTILWGNTAADAGDQVNIMDEGGVPDFFYCDIQGGQAAFGGVPHTGQYKGCIDSIPLFEDTLTGNYHLTVNSPCIDKGDPTMFDPDGTRCDIGAFYYDQTVGISEFPPDVQLDRVYCYPNPVNEISNIRYLISDIEHVKLSVFDIHGKEITTLVNELKPAGKHNVRFDASDLPAGVYFIRLQVDNEILTKKIIKL